MGDRKKKSLWNSISQKATKASQSLTEKATEAAKHSVSNAGEAITHKATEAGKTLRDTATHSMESTWKKGQDWIDHFGLESEEPLSNPQGIDCSLDELYHIFIAYQSADQG
ncbi:MAG: hypothetical protein ACRCU2_31955, partial [Planktothrix sp.]